MGTLAQIVILSILSGHSRAQDSKLTAIYQESLSEALSHFTQSIYVHLANTSESEENFVFSPLSLHSALSLLYLAIRDNSTSQHELRAAMGIINNQNLVKTAYQILIEEYRNQNSFLYGNHIWVGKGIKVDAGYKEEVTSKFGSEISNMDFTKITAVDEVNNWISEKTNNKIKKLVESFSSDTQMFLANALYFKEKWMIPFEEFDFNGNIIEKDFQTDSGKLKVPMLWQESDKFTYGEIRIQSGVLQVVTIPYENEKFEMQIILPKGNMNLQVVEHIMKDEKERDKIPVKNFNLFKKLPNESLVEYDNVNVMFPKFQVKSKFNAAHALKTLGAKQVFTSGAELDKIIAGGPIGVGNILHEAFVEVTKEGTEGVAATGIELTLFSSGFDKQITLNKPFIFIVMDKVADIPILVGRIKNPNTKLP